MLWAWIIALALLMTVCFVSYAGTDEPDSDPVSSACADRANRAGIEPSSTEWLEVVTLCIQGGGK